MKRRIFILLVVFTISISDNCVALQGATQAMEDIHSEQKMEAKRRLEDQDYNNKPISPLMKRLAEQIKSLENTGDGKDAIIFGVISEIMQDMALIVSQYESADEKASNAFDFGELQSLSDIRESIERVKQAENISIKMIRITQNLDSRLKNELAKHDISPIDIELVMRGFYR